MRIMHLWCRDLGQFLSIISTLVKQDLGIWNHLGVVVNWLPGKLMGACKIGLGKLLEKLLRACRKHLGKLLGASKGF
jgi:hypothetical protein